MNTTLLTFLFFHLVASGHHTRTYEEWTFYPEGYHVGRRCHFPADAVPEDKNHLASMTSTNEVTHSAMLGMNRKCESVPKFRNQPVAVAFANISP